MTFKEKIDKILEHNTLGINSPSGMEKHLHLGTGSILKSYSNKRKDTSPGLDVVKTILEGLRINKEWWKSGEGEIFIKNPMENTGNKVVPDSIYRDLIESNTDYRLVPKTILDQEYRIVLKSEIDSKEKLLLEVLDAKNRLIEQLSKEIAQLREAPQIHTKNA
jgi:hypothetical protein